MVNCLNRRPQHLDFNNYRLVPLHLSNYCYFHDLNLLRYNLNFSHFKNILLHFISYYPKHLIFHVDHYIIHINNSKDVIPTTSSKDHHLSPLSLHFLNIPITNPLSKLMPTDHQVKMMDKQCEIFMVHC